MATSYAVRGLWVRNAASTHDSSPPPLPQAPGSLESMLVSVSLSGYEYMLLGGSKHVGFKLEVRLSHGAPYWARRRYNEFKALHAALAQRLGKAAVPALPPGDPFSLIRTPDKEFLDARASALHAFLQQIVASPLTAAAAETRCFLDMEARPALGDEELPATLFHLVQVGLQRRLPLSTRLDLDRRAARATDAAFSLLLLRLHGGGLLLLACATDPEPWLGEMRDLVEETREAHFPLLQLVATTLSDDDVAPWSPTER